MCVRYMKDRGMIVSRNDQMGEVNRRLIYINVVYCVGRVEIQIEI